MEEEKEMRTNRTQDELEEAWGHVCYEMGMLEKTSELLVRAESCKVFEEMTENDYNVVLNALLGVILKPRSKCL